MKRAADLTSELSGKTAVLYLCLILIILIPAPFSRCFADGSLRVDTLAGGDVCDGGPASQGSLKVPLRMTIGPDRQIYFSDSENHRIRKIDTRGIITTVAGNGEPDHCGDFGPALDACLRHPTAVAFSPDGELYFADSDNNRIRRITQKGIIKPVAGTGDMGFAGDGGNALEAQLARPRGLAFDRKGNLFIADTFNHRIRIIDPSGRISTIGGNGRAEYSGDYGPAALAGFNNPRDLALTPTSLFIADTHNHSIRKIDFINGLVSTIAGIGVAGFAGDGGPARFAAFNQPRGVHLCSKGVLYIADSQNQRIRKIGLDGRVTTIAGDGHSLDRGDGQEATRASLYWPYDMYLDEVEEILYILDTNNDKLRAVDRKNIITTVAGTGSGCFSGDYFPAEESGLSEPGGLAIDKATGDLYIADTANHRIRRIDAKGIISTVAGNGQKGFTGDWGPAAHSSLHSPLAVAVGERSELFIADSANNRIRKVDSSGTITTVAGTGEFGYCGDDKLAGWASLGHPRGIAFFPGKGLLIADTKNNRIRLVDSDSGRISTIAGNGRSGYTGDGGLAVLATLNQPSAVLATSSNEIFISDTGNNRIRMIDSHGIIHTVAGSGQTIESYGLPVYEEEIGTSGCALEASLFSPTQLAYKFPNLYFADMRYQRIRVINLETGLIETFAGTGRAGFVGDGCSPQDAQFNFPRGFAFSFPYYYVSDTLNNRVRVIYRQ